MSQLKNISLGEPPRNQESPPVVAICFGALMWFVAKEVHTISIADPIRAVGTGLLACTGIVVDFLALIAFRKAKTTINLLFQDDGQSG